MVGFFIGKIMGRKPKTPKFQALTGLSEDEIKWGGNRFQDYLDNYPHLDNYSSIQDLNELVYSECMHERFKLKVARILESAKENETPALSPNLQKQIQESMADIFKQKERLGLEEKKDDHNPYQAYESLKKQV